MSDRQPSEAIPVSQAERVAVAEELEQHARVVDGEPGTAFSAKLVAEALRKAAVILRGADRQPTCANCLHTLEAHANGAALQHCRDVVADGSQCGCTRFIDTTRNQSSEAIPATPDPRAEAERLLKAFDSGDHVAVGLMGCVLNQVTAQHMRSLLAALTAKDEELRSLREASAGAQWQPIDTRAKEPSDILAWLNLEQRKPERWAFNEAGIYRFNLTGPELMRIRNALAASPYDGEWQCRFVAEDRRCCQLAKGHEGEHALTPPPGAPAATSPSEQEK